MASSWLITINQRDGAITFTPYRGTAGQPAGVNSGDNVTWDNQTNQEITLTSIQPEGVFRIGPIPAREVSDTFNVPEVSDPIFKLRDNPDNKAIGYSWVRQDAPQPAQPDAWIVVFS
jgi:hypothetical protein